MKAWQAIFFNLKTNLACSFDVKNKCGVPIAQAVYNQFERPKNQLFKIGYPVFTKKLLKIHQQPYLRLLSTKEKNKQTPLTLPGTYKASRFLPELPKKTCRQTFPLSTLIIKFHRFDRGTNRHGPIETSSTTPYRLLFRRKDHDLPSNFSSKITKTFLVL